MRITSHDLEQLKEFEKRTVEVNKEVMKGIVPRLIKNAPTFLGRDAKKNFFYRQATWFDDFMRRNVVARFFDLTALIYCTDTLRGEKLIQFAESFFAYLRAAHSVKTDAADFWEMEEKLIPLATKRRTAVVRGDKQGAREVSAEIRQIENRLPVYLKSAAGLTKKSFFKRKKNDDTSSKTIPRTAKKTT